MDNQHRKLTGYGELDQAQIDTMNELTQIGAQLREVTDRIAADEKTDRRWLATGVTDLQKGFMAVKRSIARPTGF